MNEIHQEVTSTFACSSLSNSSWVEQKLNNQLIVCRLVHLVCRCCSVCAQLCEAPWFASTDVAFNQEAHTEGAPEPVVPSEGVFKVPLRTVSRGWVALLRLSLPTKQATKYLKLNSLPVRLIRLLHAPAIFPISLLLVSPSRSHSGACHSSAFCICGPFSSLNAAFSSTSTPLLRFPLLSHSLTHSL